jgi:carboxyl-terminal processing protease
MPKWNLLRSAIAALLVSAGVLLLPGLVPPVAAQVAIPAEALPDLAAIDAMLAEGRELEQARRWSEALAHYEEAVRRYPGRREFEDRLELARSHFDLARRYADSSYQATLAKTNEAVGLEIFSEVLLKIETHYVTDPDWAHLVRRGLAQLDAALSDRTFLDRHLAQAPPERIDSYRQELTRTVHPERVQNRYEVRDVAAYAGRLAAQRLGISPTAVIFEFICGTSAALDHYSTFLTEAQLDDVYAQIEGNFVGLGVELKADNGALLIVNTITGSPAEQAGIRPGDRIVAVAGQSTRAISTDKAADILKGPEGSTVVVTVESPDGTTRDLQVMRRRVEVPSVENARIIDPQQGVGYIKLTSFQKTTSRDVDTALWKLHREGMRSLIVDVRGNPGGLLTASVDVADKFVTDGVLVSTRGRSSREDFDYQAHRVGTWRVPLVVLIDRDTASASEIFAAAIRDHRRGEVVGERSYGKGSVQGIFPLEQNQAGIRLTTAKFYGPGGEAINKLGVTPSIPVQTAAKPLGTGQFVIDTPQDEVLSAGIDAARRLSIPNLSQR